MIQMSHTTASFWARWLLAKEFYIVQVCEMVHLLAGSARTKASIWAGWSLEIGILHCTGL